LCEKLGLLSVWCKQLEILHKEFVQFVTECIDLIRKMKTCSGLREAGYTGHSSQTEYKSVSLFWHYEFKYPTNWN